MNLYFTSEIHNCLNLSSTPMALKMCSGLKCNDSAKFQIEIRNSLRLQFSLLRLRRTWSFHVLVLQRTAKKCTKIYNVSAQLFSPHSVNFLFGGVRNAAFAAFAIRHLLTTQAVPISNDVLYQSVVKFDSKVYLNKVIDKTDQIECIGVESDVEVVTYSQKKLIKVSFKTALHISSRSLFCQENRSLKQEFKYVILKEISY